MRFAILGAVHRAIEQWRNRSFVEKMRRMDDRLLDDIGLRRDQLDLLLRPRTIPVQRHGAVRPSPAIRPSLQGCG